MWLFIFLCFVSLVHNIYYTFRVVRIFFFFFSICWNASHCSSESVMFLFRLQPVQCTLCTYNSVIFFNSVGSLYCQLRKKMNVRPQHQAFGHQFWNKKHRHLGVLNLLATHPESFIFWGSWSQCLDGYFGTTLVCYCPDTLHLVRFRAVCYAVFKLSLLMSFYCALTVYLQSFTQVFADLIMWASW